jgi:hypothetical protein
MAVESCVGKGGVVATPPLPPSGAQVQIWSWVKIDYDRLKLREQHDSSQSIFI